MARKVGAEGRQGHFFLVIPGAGEDRQLGEARVVSSSNQEPSQQEAADVRDQLIKELREFGC